MARRRRIVVVVAVIAVAVAAFVVTRPPTADANASSAELGAAFGACPFTPFPFGDRVHPLTPLTYVDRWTRVNEVVSRGRDNETSTFAAEPEGSVISLVTYSAMFPGIDWALENDAAVWIAVLDEDHSAGDPVAQYVVIRTDDARSFLAGPCGDDTRKLAASFDPAMPGDLVGLTSEQISALITEWNR